jgi:EmrB/QacA subfamily drug resistance transporter
MSIFKNSESNRKWWVLVAMTSCVSMILLNQTALTVVLPFIQQDLDVSYAGTQWIVNIYLLVLTISLLAGGRLGDIIGLHRTFFLGASVFSLASILGALSFSVEWLWASRALQGIGGAMLWPASAALVFSAFPPNERGKAFGMYVSMGTIALTVGPFLGGFFAEHLSWRCVFWLNVPVIMLAILIAYFFVKKSETKQETFDYRGFISFGVGVSCIIMAMQQGQNWGWDSPLTLSLICVGTIFLIVLGKTSSAAKYPLIDFSLFRNRVFTGAVLAIFLTQFLMMISLYWTLYFQHVLEFSATAAGAIALLSGCPVILVAPLAGRLTDRYGPNMPIALGFALMTFSLIWILFAGIYLNGLCLLPGIFVFGCGAPLIFTPSSVTCLSQVSADKRGVVSGIMMTLRQFGATAGVTAIGTLFSVVHRNQFKTLLQSDSITEYLDPWLFDGLFTEQDGSASSVESFSQEVADSVISSFETAYLDAFSFINVLAVCMGLFGLFVVRGLLKKPKLI